MKRFLGKLTTPTVVTGLFIAVVCAECWHYAHLRAEQESLNAELQSLRGGEPAGPKSTDEQIAAAMAEQERETARLAAAKKDLHAAEEALPEMKGQEFRSLGYVEGFGLEVEKFVAGLLSFGELSSLPEGPEKEAKIEKTLKGLVKWFGQIELIGEMEDSAQEIARFHAAAIRHRLDLDAATATAVKAQIEKEFTKLAAEGLTRSQLPPDDTKAWYKRRDEAITAAAQRVESLIPPDRRRKWVIDQSLALGAASRTIVKEGPDGKGSAMMTVTLPGLAAPKF